MSRSRRPQCSVGRGCRCCGDAGAVRRARDAEAARIDDRDLCDPLDALMREETDRTYIGDDYDSVPARDRL